MTTYPKFTPVGSYQDLLAHDEGKIFTNGTLYFYTVQIQSPDSVTAARCLLSGGQDKCFDDDDMEDVTSSEGPESAATGSNRRSRPQTRTRKKTCIWN